MGIAHRTRRVIGGMHQNPWHRAILIMTVAGCSHSPTSMLTTRPIPAVGHGAPGNYVVRASQYAFTTDYPLDASDPLLKELTELQEVVSSTLDIEFTGPPIRIVIFSNGQAYHEFLTRNFPGLPDRRAFFIQEGKDERAVFACKGDRLREDLRHEATHALLHAAGLEIPLWLDEGLAEYFETSDLPQAVNPTHLSKLKEDKADGWRPDLRRLEKRQDLWHMTAADYRESWLWTHFLLHKQRETLLGSLKNKEPLPKSLSSRFEDPERAVLDYLNQLMEY